MSVVAAKEDRPSTPRRRSAPARRSSPRRRTAPARRKGGARLHAGRRREGGPPPQHSAPFGEAAAPPLILVGACRAAGAPTPPVGGQLGDASIHLPATHKFYSENSAMLTNWQDNLTKPSELIGQFISSS
jgi:hypothetical protein